MARARLSDFSPEFSRHYRDREFTPDRGGFPTDRYSLSFVCPACGPPYRVLIDVGPTVSENPRTWKAEPLPEAGWTDHVTITPSIDNTKAGHGRKHPTCGFHGTIIKGEVVPS